MCIACAVGVVQSVLAQTDAELGKAIGATRDTEIVFYCRSGRRSAIACEMAEGLGFRKVANYEGSWLDWTA